MGHRRAAILQDRRKHSGREVAPRQRHKNLQIPGWTKRMESSCEPTSVSAEPTPHSTEHTNHMPNAAGVSSDRDKRNADRKRDLQPQCASPWPQGRRIRLHNRSTYRHAAFFWLQEELQGKHIGAFRPRPFGLKSSCLLMCSFSQNGPIFVKFPVIFLQLFRARSESYSHLSPRFAPGSGGVEPCVRISLRFQWQGGAPGAGRASLDSRVRILSGQPCTFLI